MDRTNHTEQMVQRAQEKILGTKFCFACQKPKPIESGKSIQRGKSKTWRCFSCANKLSPVGFTKEKKK